LRYFPVVVALPKHPLWGKSWHATSPRSKPHQKTEPDRERLLGAIVVMTLFRVVTPAADPQAIHCSLQLVHHDDSR
jgi:hypothetical protein